MSEITRVDDLGTIMRDIRTRLEQLERGRRFTAPVVPDDPDPVEDGYVWINSTTNTLKARINGVTKTVTVT